MRKFFVAFALCVGIIAGGAARAENNCTGATYYDANSDTCITCPAGYDYNTDSGKTDITQCQIHCDAGAWNGKYTQLDYIESTGTQWIDTLVTLGVDFEIYLDAMVSRADHILLAGGLDVNRYNDSLFASGISGNWGNGSIEFGGYNNRFYIGISPFWVMHYNGVKKVLVRRYSPSGTLRVFSGTVGRLYNLKIYSGPLLQFNGIPARRNSDGVLGMYDMVTGQFFTNSGTGEFIAGPDVGALGGECVNVGAGYWVAASTVNFGSVGTKNACPAGTYSNNPNATSINDCAPCAGATYNDTIAASACKSCPNGYDYNTDSGKTDITQCQIHCDGGTYVSKAGNEYIELEYIESTGTQLIDTEYVPSTLTRTEVDLKFTNDTYNSINGHNAIFGIGRHTINFGNDVSQAFTVYPWLCAYGGDSDCSVSNFNINADLKTTRQTLILDAKNKFAQYGTVQRSISQTARQPMGSIRLFGGAGTPYARNEGMFVYAVRIYEDDVPVRDMIPVRRKVDGVLGMYDKVTNTFFTNAGTGEFIAGPDVGALGGECVDVGAGYWAAASTVNFGSLGVRTACPVGTTTVGYGHGADSANDCGRVLHIGDYVLYARRDRVTSPSLNIRIPEEGIIYYINLGSENHGLSRLHLMLDGVQYTAYDDSLYYGERNFDTGEQIAQ